MMVQLRLLLTAFLATLLVASPARGDSPDQGLPGNGSVVTLKPTEVGFEATILIGREAKLTEAVISSTDPKIKEILVQQVQKDPEPQPTDSTKSADGGPPALPPPSVTLVRVTLTKPQIRQGTYPLTMTGSRQSERIVRDLWLVVPAAKIDAVETLTIMKRSGWLRSDVIEANRPQLWETTQRAWLTNITLEQKGDTVTTTGEPAGRIKAKNGLADVKAGSNELITLSDHYTLDGAFPLGRVTGKLALQADQLAEPVTFNFEVQSRLFSYCIFLPMGLGLALGWVVRNRLTKRKQLDQEKEKTFALLGMIDDALDRNEDEKFRAAAGEAKALAVAASRRTEVGQVTSDTSRAQKNFEAALEELNRRRAALDERIAAFLSVLRAGYRLPKDLTTVLTAQRAPLETGLNGLDANNVREAQADLDNRAQTLIREAQRVAKSWSESAQRLDGAIDPLAPLLAGQGADLKTRLGALLNPLRAQVTKVVDGTNLCAEQLKAVLDSLHAAIYALEALMSDMARLMERQIGQWTTVLPGAHLPPSEGWPAWINAAQALLKKVRETPAADPATALEDLAPRAAACAKLLKDALIGQVTDPAAKDAMKAMIEEGKYAEAVAKAAELRPAPPPATSEGRLLGRRLDLTSVISTFDSLYSSAAHAPMPSVAYGLAGPQRSAVTPISVLAALSRRDLVVTNSLLSLIYAVLIAGGGYFLFADKWVGGWLEWVTVFFWAFTTDIGADAVTTLSRNFKIG